VDTTPLALSQFVTVLKLDAQIGQGRGRSKDCMCSKIKSMKVDTSGMCHDRHTHMHILWTTMMYIYNEFM
jgi:hypothetical protein